MESENTNSSTLSDKQRARIERNRQRAILLRNARLASHPYSTKKSENDAVSDGLGQPYSTRLIDTGGGFLLDPEEHNEAQKEINIVFEPGPVLGGEQINCEECGRRFLESFLHKNYGVLVCDGCRDNDGKHALITKTDAKAEFLLKDCDLDQREPPLKCIVKKNPHRSNWGDMKLYLKSQVAARSLEIWESEDAIEEEKERRASARDKKKQKQFDKKVKELRRAVRTSTWKRDSSQHVHHFPGATEEGGEVYDEKTDTWTKTCKTCGHKVTYEKM